MTIRTPTLALLATITTLTGILAYTTPAAQAGLGFAFPPVGSSIEDPITDGGTYFEGHAELIAVDGKNGDTLVVSHETETIEVFNPAGEHVGTLTGAHTPEGSFKLLKGLAVDDSTGRVYVVDKNSNVVDILELRETGSPGKTTVEEGSHVEQITGTSSGSFSSPFGVTVDQATGDVYVVDNPRVEVNGNGIESIVVDVFDSSGKYKFQITEASVPKGSATGPEVLSSRIAVDGKTGELFIGGIDYGNIGEKSAVCVYVFNSSGEYVTKWTGAKSPAQNLRPAIYGYELLVAADDTSGYLYLADVSQGVIDVFDPSNVLEEKYVGQIKGTPGEPFYAGVGEARSILEGVAIDQATGDEYVLSYSQFRTNGTAHQQNVVDVFGPPTQLPSPFVGLASGVGSVGATLEGSVDPEGQLVASCEFEYGLSETLYGQSMACSPSAGSLGEGPSPVGVSADAGGLRTGYGIPLPGLGVKRGRGGTQSRSAFDHGAPG